MFVIIIISQLCAAILSPLIDSHVIVVAAASDNKLPNSMESLPTATSATTSANARNDTSVESLMRKRPSYSIFHSVGPKMEPYGTPLDSFTIFS